MRHTEENRYASGNESTAAVTETTETPAGTTAELTHLEPDGSNKPPASDPEPSVTVYPIANADKMPKGAAVPFAVGADVNIYASDTPYGFDAVIVRSYAELRAIYEADSNPNGYDYISSYNGAFFEDNAVILLFIGRGSGSIRQEIHSLVKKGNELCIGMTTFVPGPGMIGTSDIAYWRITLDVKKADVDGVDKISCYNRNKSI